MGLPAGLSVEALKRRIDVEHSINDVLLDEFLESAVEQAQQPAPNGCGLLLTPDPPLAEDGTDTLDPAERAFTIHGRTVVLSDGAREIDTVTVDGEEQTEYTTIPHKGLTVAVRLPHDRRCEFWGWLEVPICSCRRRQRHVTVTGRFGFVDIPPSLREAIYVLAGRLFYERNVQYADQVQLAEGAGVETYYRQLPPRAKLAFDSFAVPKAIAGLS